MVCFSGHFVSSFLVQTESPLTLLRLFFVQVGTLTNSIYHIDASLGERAMMLDGYNDEVRGCDMAPWTFRDPTPPLPREKRMFGNGVTLILTNVSV
jgi:hypothetical protein